MFNWLRKKNTCNLPLNTCSAFLKTCKSIDPLNSQLEAKSFFINLMLAINIARLNKLVFRNGTDGEENLYETPMLNFSKLKTF